MSTGSADRRPAIWPWLVMPLVTLAMYYGLDQLDRHHRDHNGAYQSAPDPQATATADTAVEPETR
jgi:hypothetical protein